MKIFIITPVNMMLPNRDRLTATFVIIVALAPAFFVTVYSTITSDFSFQTIDI